MSFQDIGKNRSPKNKRQQPVLSGGSIGTLAVNGGNTSVGEGYGSISNEILQYQRNVGILSKIIDNIGSASNASTVENQFNVQVDVIRQLGSKIEIQLKDQLLSSSSSISTMSRSDLSRSRATHTKLTRDYNQVKNTLNNLLLEARRKRNIAESRRSEEEEVEQKNLFEKEIGYDTAKLQMQLREDRVNEEIMREREEEIRNINKGMHQVNEIYKDLAHIVSAQQEGVDEVEVHMEQANNSAEAGLKQIEKATAKSANSSCIIS